MYSFLFSAALENLLFLALHITGSGSFPRALSPKEERDCLAGIRAGDPAARSRLIEHNLRLVAHIAKKYYAAGGEQDDLISIGTIGLIKAVSTFDSEKGSRFSTYASRCIENEILMYFRSRKKAAQDISLFDPIDTDKDGNALTLGALMADEGNILESRVVAWGMEHPNGIRIRGNYMYVTQSYLHPIHHESGKLVSGVYRFALDEENVKVNNDLSDKNLFATFVTENPDCQYGADGIVFDREGNLYVGNFGDASINRITFREDGSLLENKAIAKDFSQLESTDGMIFDENGSLYIADFNANAIGMMTPDGTIRRIAQSPDSDGLHGELNQPGEPIVWDGRIIASCFDLVTGPGKVNTGHSMPATLAQLELER